MLEKRITFCGQPQVLRCDGQCHKAWGINYRPKVELTNDIDDIAYLADHEVGFAPAHPGTTEGGQAKPCATVATDPAIMNKWCARECERSSMQGVDEAPEILTFDKRRYNIPRRTGRNPETIISGGQTGVDRAALDAGLELRIAIGGFIPKGRRTEEGPLDAKYPLKELATADYLSRTFRNINYADATLILSTRWPLTGGTYKTRIYAERSTSVGGKGMDTVYACNPETTDPVDVARWAARYKTLNIAGPRESGRPGTYQVAKTFLLEVFR